VPRYKLTLEYDGSDFVGWQRQINGLSVQQVLEEAIEGFCGERVTAGAAGRTDAGVHALGQVVHIDLGKAWPADTVRDALNDHLRPAPVSVLAAAEAEAGFDARFSARARHYLYRIVNRRAPLSLEGGRAWQVSAPLDAAAMQAAANMLVGPHDFTTFRSVHCQAHSPVKTLDVLEIERAGDEVLVRARARSFLHNQVRAMVGTLKRVGEGRMSVAEVAAALAARDRSAAGPTAPACGLYLAAVDYGDEAAPGRV
jgi:tRNA pseudouridine38-40 synthase